MKDHITIRIDGHAYEVDPSWTVLQAARANRIPIPTLCYHPALRPSGSCKLCVVEILGPAGRNPLLLACVIRVREGMEIRTQSEIVQNARLEAFKHLLAMAPQSEVILELARTHGVHLGPPPDGCVRCSLCIRVCREVVGPGALKMEKRNGVRYVVPVEGQCIGCGTCVNICPTHAISLRDEKNVRTISIRDEIIGMHPLERCEGCGKLFATQKFLKHIEDHTLSHPHVKELHLYCPTCAKLFSPRAQSMTKSIKRVL